MLHESDGAHFFNKIGLTVRCLQCGKKFYLDLKYKPDRCPKCNRYETIEEHYERG